MFKQNVTLSPGTGTFTSHTFEILIMLLGAFLLGLWLGWALWSRYKQMADQLRMENMSNLATAETLRTELTTARNRITVLETDGSNLSAQVVSLNRNNENMRNRITELESESAAASSQIRQLETELGLSYGPDTEIADDVPLELYELSADDYPEATEPEELQEPEPEATEPEELQAQESEVDMIPMPEAEAEAEEEPAIAQLETPAILNIEPVPLETSPREVTITIPEMTFIVPIAEPIAAAPPETIVELAPAVVPPPPPVEADALTVIEGIGPKIQMLFNQYGIYTYRQLADTEVARMKEILHAAGSQLAMHDPGTWPSQANLAANDQWEALKSIQGFLKGGKVGK
ncbi:MAG: hypothetical protein LH618_06655 [Saprospiraceae bacterium]|nr:hypothetical protein [Saprospiraceae bacterium]